MSTKIKTITIVGFDPLGEPRIRVKSNGTLQLTFEFMPPSFVSARDETQQFDCFDLFDKRLEYAIGAPVLWDDREVFIIQSNAPIVLERLVQYLQTFHAPHKQRWIKIHNTPLGDLAPEGIRAQWVGAVLPLSEFARVQPRQVSKTVTLKSGKTKERLMYGYSVETLAAMDVLAQHAPQAAQWWREHQPELMQAGKMLLFYADCCTEVVLD